MFGHESKPARVYKYGAKPPEGESYDLIREQIDRAWRYRNDLVARELDRRRQARAIIRDHRPEIVRLEEQVDGITDRLTDVRDRIRAGNQRSRSREEPDEALRAEIRDLRAVRSDLYDELRSQERKAYKDPEIRPELDALDDDDLEQRKALRAECGLYNGTYLTVGQGLGGIRSGRPPRFIRRAEWGGQVAVQLRRSGDTPSPTWAELRDPNGSHSQYCHIKPDEPDYPVCGRTGRVLAPKPGGRRSERPWYRMWIRVGSEGPGNRTPIWASVRFVLHRVPPKDARVKWAKIVRRRQGTDERWSVQLVLARDAWTWDDAGDAEGTASLNLGHRQMEGGDLRVAYVTGSDGASDELRVPAERLDVWAHADHLRSIRDRELDGAREYLVDWLSRTEDVPEWMREQTATLARWRSAARLAALVIEWRGARFAGDGEALARIEAWRAQDKHLYDWEAAERGQYMRWRKDCFRRFAARLRQRYEHVIVDDTDWAEMRRTPAPEEHTTPERLNPRERASRAAPGLLRETIQHGHPSVEVESAAYVTQECSVCGSEPAHDWDAAAELIYRCASGHEIDQDRNAATNLLARASGTVVGE